MNITKPLLLTLSLSLSACLSTGGSPIKNLNTPTIQSSSLDYLNSESFDNKLSNAMKRADAEIQVSVLNPFFPDNMPERIDAWLTVIKETDGKIETAPAESEKNIDIISIVINLYSVWTTLKDTIEYYLTYSPAKKYNATLLYRRNNEGKTIIEKVVFTYR
ncbi:MAG TPA: hypothetical protein ENG03_03800 [Thioploca sp.]|nr:hypothetical protein [Thioploca sp.]